MKVFKQLLKEFWIPFTIAILWTTINAYNGQNKPKNWSDYVNIAMPSFFFVSWLTGQYFRVRKQEHVSSTLGNIEQRVEAVLGDISNQAKNMKIISDRQLYQTFDICLDHVREAKEEIADLNRQLIKSKVIDLEKFNLKRDNPFYSARRYLNQLVNYALYTFNFDTNEQLGQRYNRTAYQTEELVGVITSLINQLNHQKLDWKTEKSKELLNDIKHNLGLVKDEILKKTKYNTEHYKGYDLDKIIGKHLETLQKTAS